MGTAKWKPLKDADGKKGIRYREHPTRKHGATPDRYYSLAYWWQGKTVTEKIGWASEGWTPTKCFRLLAQLRHNQSTGNGPCTMAEIKVEAKQNRQQARRKAEAQKKLDVSFKNFFDDIFMPDAETRWKPDTARKAREHVINWINPVTESIPMHELGLPHIIKIKAALAKKKRSPRQQQYVFRTFSMVWNAAQDNGIVNTPCPTKSKSFILPKVDNERLRYLTVKEEKRLLKAINKRSKPVHDIAVIAIDCGLRFSEIAGLTWTCIDIDQQIIRVLNTKSGRDRFVPMTSRVKKVFESMGNGVPSDFVFPAKGGKRRLQIPSSFTRAVVDAKLNENVEDSKMRASFHSLRHTTGSRLVQAGVDIYRVQRLLGHSTPVMTARYSKLADDDLKQAIQKMERKYRTLREEPKVIPFRQAQ